jgi:hypothetical protein
MIVNEAYRASEILNSYMEKIQQWSDQWLVNFNQRKTETMVISNFFIKPYHPPIYMNDAIIHEVEQHKHLGVIFQDDGCWNSHIDYIIDKATPRLNLMSKLKFKLSRELIQIIYFSFVRPILEMLISFGITFQYILGINIEAARIVTGATKLCSKEKLYVETGWETMSCRRIKHKVIKFHEMFH